MSRTHVEPELEPSIEVEDRLPPVSMSLLGPSDAPAIEALWQDYFPAVEPRESAIAAVTSPGDRDWLGYGRYQDHELVGFGLMTYTDDPANLFNLPDASFGDSGEVATFYMTCVHPEHRHQGIGTYLGALRLERARAAGVDRVVGIGWQAGERIYENLGFDQLREVTGYYDHEPGDVTLWRRWL